MSDKYFSSVVLLMGCEGTDGSSTFIDESLVGRTLTRSGQAQIDTDQFKFGAASGLFDGNADFVTAPDSADWSFGSSPFTVEGWMRFNDLNTGERGGCLASHYNNSGNQRSWGLYYDNNAGHQLTFIRSSDGTATSSLSANWPGGAPALGTWYHVAADRDAASTLRVYLNGVVLGSAALSTFSFHNSTDTLSVGRLNTTAGFRRWLNGWLDEVRITNGVARYAGAFKPPQGRFSRYKATGVTTAVRPSIIATMLAA